MALTGRQYEIAAGPYAATVVEVGAGLRRLTKDGADVTFAYGEDELPPRGCGTVLVPWPNRIRGGHYRFEGREFQLPLTEPSAGNAIHGLGRANRWSAVQATPASVTLALDIPPQTGWTFEVLVEITYALDPLTGLTVTTRAVNHGSGRAPFGAGFHPYVALGGTALDEVELVVPAASRLVADDRGVPVGTAAVAGTEYDFRTGRRLGKLRLDQGFSDLALVGGAGEVQVRTRERTVAIRFGETFRFLQVFTPDIVSAGTPGIAVEPMTCAPDAFNSGAGLILLEAGGSWTGSWSIASG